MDDSPSGSHSVKVWSQPTLSPLIDAPYLHGWGCRCGAWGGLFETPGRAWTEAMDHLKERGEGQCLLRDKGWRTSTSSGGTSCST